MVQNVTVGGTSPPSAQFCTFFTQAFTIPPFGFVELTVLFTPMTSGSFDGTLIIKSDDARSPAVVPL